MEGVLDRPRFVEDYPFSELRLVPERLSERVNGHFVAYPADPGHYQLEQADELAEGFVFPLGQTPEIDIGSFSIYQHRELFEKFRRELSETPDRIALKACEPFEGHSFQILDEQAVVAGIFFTVLQSSSSHRDVESLKVRFRIGRTIILWYFEFSRFSTLIFPAACRSRGQRW